MKKLIIICVVASSLMAATQASAYYTETWDSGSLEGWTINTTKSNVAAEISGGNPGGYLKTWGTGLVGDAFDIGAQTYKTVFTGDFSAKGVIGVSVDISFISGSFDGAWVRFRHTGPEQRGWLYPLTTTYQTNWQTFPVSLNPGWTDIQARAAGWLIDNDVFGGSPSASFQTTMSDVYSAEVRISGIDDVEAGIDNFSLIPAPGAILLGGIGVGLVGWLRRRRTL